MKMYPTWMLTTSNRSREQVLTPLPSPMANTLLLCWIFLVEVATQLVVIRSSGVLVCMCALTQHSYAVPGSNPLTVISVVVVLMLDTLTSWISFCPWDSDDVVHDKSYPLTFLSLLGIDWRSDHFIVTEVESAIVTEMSCDDWWEMFATLADVAWYHSSLIHTSTISSWASPLLLTLSSRSLHTVYSVCTCTILLKSRN